MPEPRDRFAHRRSAKDMRGAADYGPLLVASVILILATRWQVLHG